jgi:hypothetical protein
MKNMSMDNIYFMFVFTVLFVGGVSLGWGQPLGAYIGSRKPEPEKAESWQFGNLRYKPFTSVLVRGLIWGLCTLPAVYFNAQSTVTFIVSIFLAFPLAAYVARKIVAKNPLDSFGWEIHEVIRGALLGTFIVLVKLLFEH